MAFGSKSEGLKVCPIEDVLLYLMDYLVDPLLPLRVSEVPPQEDAQKSVAKQMFAVASIYNYYYYYREEKPDLRYLDLLSFSNLAVVLKPSLASYMKLTGNQTFISDDNLSITEKAIKEACDTVLSLDSQAFTDWPISKVAVLLIDSKNENCMLRFGGITEGVWSLFERDLIGKSGKINLKNKVSEEKVGGKRKRKSLSICDDVLLQLAYDAVEDGTGIKSSELKLLASHDTYSLTEKKAAVQFYMMQCSRSINIKEQVPLKLLVESLQGPLVEQREYGMWGITLAVEFYHMLPYVEFISFWLSGKAFRVPTLKRRDSQSTAESCEKEIDQTVIPDLPQNSNNDNLGKKPTKDSEKVRSLVILENEEVEVNSEIPDTENEVDQTVKQDLPVPEQNSNNDDSGKLPTEDSEKVRNLVILENEEVKVNSEIPDTENEVDQTVKQDLPVPKRNSNNDDSGKVPTEDSEKARSLAILENEEVEVNSEIPDTENEVDQTVKQDLPVPERNSNNDDSGKVPTEDSEKVRNLVILENDEVKANSEIPDTENEVDQTVKQDLPVPERNSNNDDSWKVPTEDSEKARSLVILENEEVEVNSEIPDTENEVDQTVKQDLPVPKQDSDNEDSGKKPTEDSEKVRSVVILENEEVELNSEIPDIKNEVDQTVEPDLPIPKQDSDNEDSGKKPTEDSEKARSVVILENEEVELNSEIPDIKNEVDQTVEPDLPIPKQDSDNEDSGKKPTEDSEKVRSVVILENEEVELNSEIPDIKNEVDQTVEPDLPIPKQDSDNEDSGKKPTEDSEKVRSVVILENEEVELNSEIPDTKNEVDQTVKLDLPIPKQDSNNEDSGKKPTEDSEKVIRVVILENEEVEVNSEIPDTKNEVNLTIKPDLPIPKQDSNNEDSRKKPTEDSKKVISLVILENEEVKVNSEIPDTENEVVRTVESDLVIPKQDSINEDSGKKPTEDSEKVRSLVILENEEVKVNSEIPVFPDTEKEVVRTVESDLPVSDNDVDNHDFGNIDYLMEVDLPEELPTENGEVILENEKIEVDSEIPDTEEEVTKTVTSDLPVPNHSVNDDELGNTNNGMEVDLPEEMATENREQVFSLAILENEKIKVDSEISDTENEVIQTVNLDLPAANPEYSVSDSELSKTISVVKVDLSEKMPTENSKQASSVVILENKRVMVDFKILDEVFQTVKLELPVCNHSAGDNELGSTNSETKINMLEKLPTENIKPVSSLIILEDKKIEVEPKISDTKTESPVICIDNLTEKFDEKSDISNLANMMEESGEHCEILEKAHAECDKIKLLLSGPSSELTSEMENGNTSNKVSLKLRVYQPSRKRKRNLKTNMVDSLKPHCTECRDEKMLSEVNREIENQVIPFEDKTKYNLELQNLSASEASEDSQSASSHLFVKRQKLYSQMCSKVDSLALCESYIARIRDGGDVGLASKCVETFLAGNYDSMLGLGMQNGDYGKPQDRQKKTETGFYVPGKSSCRDLEFTCLKNNWGLPRYIVEPSDGMFVANVFVHRKDGEIHSMGGLESKPCEARESAAAQMMIAKLGSLNE